MKLFITLVALLLVGFRPASGQIVLSGHLRGPRLPGGEEQVPYSAIYAFASPAGPAGQAQSFRTWETHPAGWYRVSGLAGHYTLVFSCPSHFMRPIVRSPLVMRDGEQITSLDFAPRLEYAVFEDRQWDSPAAHAYYQPFVASGTGVTQVGFRVASDGVDGGGPGKQDFLISIHQQAGGPPDQWPQAGPSRPVLDVDSGGAKNHLWCAGWDSGEVPTVPGRTYAVCVRTAKPDGRFQPFWLSNPSLTKPCYRVDGEGGGYREASLWMGISSDGDGLLISYNKKVQQEFGQFAGFALKWSQTFVARGRGMASVILYSAVGGTQPGLARQRVVVRVRRDGPGGEPVGMEKIGVGNGNYTGDASWGVFGAGFAPGEVPLVPGQRYAVEIESIESRETLEGLVNIKGQVSDIRPGFNPYRKHHRDSYEHGTAFRGGTEEQSFDLDMQILEYEFGADGPGVAVVGPELLVNGNMEVHAVSGVGDPGWERFSLVAGTTHLNARDRDSATNQVARVAGGGLTGMACDGGYVQRVSGLNKNETYRVDGRVRSSWAVDEFRQCYVGHDRTGQTTNGASPTIEWILLPPVHGRFVPYQSEPIRPATDAISLWLRGKTTKADGTAFKADFDDFSMRRVRTVPPGPERAGRPAFPADKSRD